MSTTTDQEAVIQWLLDTPPGTRMKASVPLLCEAYNFSESEAEEVIRELHRRQYGVGGADADAS
ncbi:hypothetical protein V3589_03135 [Sinorhizobium fredii]|uniref:hypothetical protein n=1 Tax=Rhizobium fredii TaxID=380 RepID=UPI0030B2D498